jgi:hypothetical protein
MPDAIDQRRRKALHQVISALHNYLVEYQGDTLHCSEDCDTMLLGALTKGMKSIELLTRPDPPFPGFSFDGLACSIRKFRFPSVHAYKTKRKCPSPSPDCGITSKINTTLKSLEDSLCGLDLSDIVVR